MMRHGGAVLVECLKTLGATRGFGVPGESYLAVLDAFHDSAFDFVLCRNEGGAAFMAAGYGKLTGQPGLCFVTRGPGATNAAIGVHTAMQDSVPMILFVGQVGTDLLGREAFQEIDYRAMFGSVAKWVTQVDRVERLPETLARAWHTALAGRPGPVVVALPEDMLAAQTDVPALSRGITVPEPAPENAAMAQAQKMLSAAKHPLIIAGGSGWSDTGRAALQAFAEAAQIPVLCSFRCQDLIDHNASVYAGDAGVGMAQCSKDLICEADLILALNIRFGEMTTDAYTLLDVPEAAPALIHAHPSDAELGKIYQPDLGLHAGPNAVAYALSGLTLSKDWAAWREQARADWLAYQRLPEQPGPVDMGQVIAHLQEVLPGDAILTNGAGNFATWTNKFFRFGPGHRLLAPQSGAMGYGLPAAIAAKATYPERCVVCVAGDGDFQMNCQELGTAMQAGAQPIVLIVNNGSYGTIRMHQERHYPERVSGTALQNPDFAALARSYGFHGERIARTEDFADAFARALASETGAVLDLDVGLEAITPKVPLSALRG